MPPTAVPVRFRDPGDAYTVRAPLRSFFGQGDHTHANVLDLDVRRLVRDQPHSDLVTEVFPLQTQDRQVLRTRPPKMDASSSMVSTCDTYAVCKHSRNVLSIFR